jgi:HemY protein
MIRVIMFLVAVGVLALGAAWLADRPGDVTITWLRWRIDTSVMVLVSAVAAVTVIAVALWSLLRALVRSPDSLASSFRRRRGARGYQAISSGLIAIGSGDVRAARKYAHEVERIAPGEPLALMLAAQTAQLAGDRPAAEAAFRTMAQRPDTKIFGLRGLFVEAQRGEDMAAAQAYAEEAAKSAPSLAWAGQAVLEFRCAAGDWVGALGALDSNQKHGLVDKPTYRRQRAVLLTARALEIADSERERARALALEAVKLAPSLVPAAALAARLLADAQEYRKASRLLEAGWRANPHPDLAAAYAHLRLGESARDRLARVETLARQAPGHVDSALAVARAALDAREFAVAHTALKPWLASPTQRVAELMAELEALEHGNEGRAREWMTRALHAQRDPAWTADGFVSERWMPVSPVSGRLDAVQWKVPLADLTKGGNGDADARPVIDAVPSDEPPPPPPAPPPPPPKPKEQAVAIAEPLPAALPSARRRIRPEPGSRPEAVIPLVHVPDDPGPEQAPEPEPPADAPRRLRLFK